MKIRKILIANRAEVAQRIIQTCKKLNILTVAIYSSADKNMPYVKMADEAVWIGENDASQSYLNINKIINACLKAGVDAVHPGYGFLSENAEFVEYLEKNNIIFIGPDAKTIRQMGDKINARQIMSSHDVPVVPGYHGPDQSTQRLLEESKKIGFPIMVKASAGGGGRGLRIVEHADDLKSAVESASSEARNAFGNENIFLEKYITNPKHIEVQILADKHNQTYHLFERECSMQRRHQKVIEECPSPSITKEQRQEITELAIKAASCVQYTGAGTVEFIYSIDDNKFYFLEMNTRLQVEHPVTEMVTGMDLVFEQIRIAEGKKISVLKEEISCKGHSIEVRVYAEDPQNNFLPDAGILKLVEFPSHDQIRIDTGVKTGSEISIYYDPMIAKLIVHGKDRNAALEKLNTALNECVILGIKTNLDFLNTLLQDQSFQDGSYTTNTIHNNYSTYKDKISNHEQLQEAILAGALIHYSNIQKRSKQKSKKSPSFKLW